MNWVKRLRKSYHHGAQILLLITMSEKIVRELNEHSMFVDFDKVVEYM